ncbi:hypothetical protein DPMN_160106 [Dreissena polymorpha]|uniref:Uncharacterized protein n=1 Tax=Dreissena polymorpha TaxID=45954 RepID=A0A9D4IRB5_DREPO|nr:hypothetical protein DPMN_160106 [Dreissena polymorpha]
MQANFRLVLGRTSNEMWHFCFWKRRWLRIMAKEMDKSSEEEEETEAALEELDESDKLLFFARFQLSWFSTW